MDDIPNKLTQRFNGTAQQFYERAKRFAEYKNSYGEFRMNWQPEVSATSAKFHFGVNDYEDSWALAEQSPYGGCVITLGVRSKEDEVMWQRFYAYLKDEGFFPSQTAEQPPNDVIQDFATFGLEREGSKRDRLDAAMDIALTSFSPVPEYVLGSGGTFPLHDQSIYTHTRAVVGDSVKYVVNADGQELASITITLQGRISWINLGVKHDMPGAFCEKFGLLYSKVIDAFNNKVNDDAHVEKHENGETRAPNSKKANNGGITINNSPVTIAGDFVGGDLYRTNTHSPTVPELHLRMNDIEKLERTTLNIIQVLSQIAVPAPSHNRSKSRSDLFAAYTQWRLIVEPLLGPQSKIMFEEFENYIAIEPNSKQAANNIRYVSQILNLIKQNK